MKVKKLWITTISLFMVVVIIRIFSFNPQWVENYYSTRIYLYISYVLKLVTGILPFSIGDVLYTLLFLYFLWRLLTLSKLIINKKITTQYIRSNLLILLLQLICVYIIFNIFWGINYNRKGIAYQLCLKTEKYSPDDLININSVLLQNVNKSKTALLRNNTIRNKDYKQCFNESISAYEGLSNKFPFLYQPPTIIKKSLWGWLGNYLGFSGYYNPFTGEAQVNTTIPYFLLPYTSCHEIAHQLGYAKENEANFVGYLAASSCTDTLFHYSVYLELFIYANQNLYILDSTLAKSYSKQLSPEVKIDIREWRNFNIAHKNPIEPVINWLYGKYLENNQQPSGILSYDEVTGFLIAYYKKYGVI